jgi:hypothetical protein
LTCYSILLLILFHCLFVLLLLLLLQISCFFLCWSDCFCFCKLVEKCIFFGWPGSTRVNPSDPWPDHWTESVTGSSFKTMVVGALSFWRHVRSLGFESVTLSCWNKLDFGF